MRRIVIIGNTGSGKTMLGKRLSEKSGIGVVDLDNLHWLPGWQARDRDDMRRLVADVAARDRWIISGNYSRMQDLFWPKADALIWLDYSFCRTLWQLLRRTFRRLMDGLDICNGNRESWRLFLSRKSILLWFFQSFKPLKKRYEDVFSQPQNMPHARLIRLRSPRATDLWFSSLGEKDFA